MPTPALVCCALCESTEQHFGIKRWRGDGWRTDSIGHPRTFIPRHARNHYDTFRHYFQPEIEALCLFRAIFLNCISALSDESMPGFHARMPIKKAARNASGRPRYVWWAQQGSNLQPRDYESPAPPLSYGPASRATPAREARMHASSRAHVQAQYTIPMASRTSPSVCSAMAFARALPSFRTSRT